MITKKLKKGMEQKLLGILYRRYVETFGRGVRNLNEYPVLITASEVFLSEIPEMREVQGLMARDLFIDTMQELQASGYVRFDGKMSFFLTEAGYHRAAMTPIDRFLEFCNKNEGLAVPISVVSLIISIIALFT
ncbi:hypothetical protein [Pseudomonas sp. NPDC088444]|uniref:hypothetical protein n=1 Tax=Pseudomonas sp. NPDC088444 TaxID=3364456 RepID=UPI00384FDCBE